MEFNLLSEKDLERYSRQIILKNVGEGGQQKLLNARVLVIGVGGLGSPALIYLASAGVGAGAGGELAVIDFDNVCITNLTRQIIHTEADISRPKVISALESINALNSDVKFKTYNERLTQQNIKEIFKNYDYIIDGSDNFATRFLVNKTAWDLSLPLISGALSGFEGQIIVVDHKHNSACYACGFPVVPNPDNVSRCDTVGIFGSVAGVVGTILATEALKVILDIGSILRGKLLIVDTLEHIYRVIELAKNETCECCSKPRAKK